MVDAQFGDDIYDQMQRSGSWQFPQKGLDILLDSCVYGVALLYGQFLRIIPKKMWPLSEAKTSLESHKVVFHLPDRFFRHIFLIRTRE